MKGVRASLVIASWVGIVFSVTLIVIKETDEITNHTNYCTLDFTSDTRVIYWASGLYLTDHGYLEGNRKIYTEHS